MAFSDFLLSVQKQLAALCSRTDEDGTALPDLPITLDSEAVTVADVELVAGVAPQMDDTDKLGVSVYGKGAAAGDTPLLLASGGQAQVVTGGTASAADAMAIDNVFQFQRATGSQHPVIVAPWRYNGTTWDRLRNNVELTVLASAARTATTASADLVNYNARGVWCFLDITAVPGGDTVQLTLDFKDAASGLWQNIITDTAQSATSQRKFMVYPGIIDTGSKMSVISVLALPRIWRVRMVHSAASSFTYSVGACYIN